VNTGIIDVHHHILPSAYPAAVGERLGPQGLLGPPPQWSPALSIEAMDRNGIGTAVTSISSPGVWFGDVRETWRLARLCNEYASGLKRDHPGRFGMFAVLPLPDVDASLREIEYVLDALKGDGFGLLTNYSGKYPGDALFAPVFDELNRRKAVVFFHPTMAGYGRYFPEIPAPSLEFPFDTTRAITSLLYSGTLARCRSVRFIFSHAGGTVPFLAERIARLIIRPEFRSTAPDGVLAEFARLYYDTALAANPLCFSPLRQLVSTSNILFGSDYPHAGEPTMNATVQGLRDLKLDEADRSAIETGNGLRLFPGLTAT
jgi:predicted TIM-barrel fold metal-dependent hydrolase